MNFFAIFFPNFLPRFDHEQNSGLKFFSLYCGQSLPVLAENNARKRFFNFFAIFFPNFLPQVEHERNSRLKFFSLYFGLSHPVLDKNNAGKRFFNFLNYFAIFFGIFLTESSMNGIRYENFFLSFSAYLIPFWQKIMPKRGFF